MPAILVFIPGCMVCTYLFLRYRAMTERTNIFVREQKKLTELHYTFVRRQIRSMEQEQEKLFLSAAHERTDIEVTNEMKQHDDDLMMDDEFWN